MNQSSLKRELMRQVEDVSARLGKRDLTDGELFTSPEYNEKTQIWAEDMILGTCSYLRALGFDISKEEEDRRLAQLSVEVTYDTSKDSYTARTDGQNILINAGNKLVQSYDSQFVRHYAIQGFRVHEVGHVLFSDMAVLRQWVNSLQNGFLWPAVPNVEGATELMARLADVRWRDVFIEIANSIRNPLEDSYIENEIFTIFGGLPSIELATVDDAQIQRAKSFIERMNSTEDEQTPRSIRVMSALISQILMYGKYGILEIDGCDPEIQEMFENITPIIDGAKIERDPRKRIQMLNEVLCECFPVLDKAVQDIVKELQQNPQQNPQQNQKQNNSKSGKSQSSGNGSSSGTPNGAPGTDSGDSEGNGNSSSQGNSDSDDGNSNDANGANQKPDETTAKKILDAIKKVAQSFGLESNEANNNNASKKKSSTSIFKAKKGGTNIAKPMQKPTDQGEPDLTAAKIELDMLKNDITTQKAHQEVEKSLAKALNNEAATLRLKGSPYGKVMVSRASDVGDMKKARAVYDKYAAQILPIVKNLQRKLQTLIKDEENDDTISGLLMGTRVEARSLYHKDGKYFSRKNFPREAPRLAIGYLCDESGSMSRAALEQSIKAGILIEALCKSMELPCIICGFTSGFGTANLISYVEPNSVDGNDKYRLLGMASRGSTPTAPALTYMAARLKKIPASTHLLIVSTDGASDEGATAMNGVVKAAKQNGVIVIGAGLGVSGSAIKKEFLNAYLDVTDIRTLPDNLLRLIKKMLLN